MAGGEGTRLRPLTSNQPKPMVPVVGKPCMEHIVELLRGHGMEDVIVTVAFLPQAIRSYFGDGDDHVLHPMTAEEVDDVFHARLADDRNHRLRLVRGERAQARALAAGHHDRFHASTTSRLAFAT